MPKTIAIMQPYFVPYLGYFRLFSQTDLFVIYDCVQFPRRGYVHRNQVPGVNGEPKWLTLPLAKCDQKTTIHELAWRSTDIDPFIKTIQALFKTWKFGEVQACQTQWLDTLSDFSGGVVDYLERTLRFACQTMAINQEMIRSSTLRIPASVKGQDRILAICRELQATHYVNSPGGRDLYQAEAFERAGIELRFLESFQGSFWSVAYRLLAESPQQLRSTL